MSSKDGSSAAPTPASQSSAPAGAYLGSVGNGKKKVSVGGGQSVIVDESSGSDTIANFSTPVGRDGKPLVISAPGRSVVSSATPVSINQGSSSPASVGGGRNTSGEVPTTVNQKPPENATPKPDGSETTTVNAGPRSDFSVVLAGQVGRRPDRSPARSNNFVSLVGGAGGLGRKTTEAKRTLIGGA